MGETAVTRKEKYARLLIRVGLNVQKGQNVVISSPVECADFARMCADEAYAAGCREVIMNWGDDYLTRQKFLHADDSVFNEYPAWLADFRNGEARRGSPFLSIHAADPEILKGVSPERISNFQKVSGKALEPFRTLEMSNGFPWCIASVPIPSWSRLVFPDLDADAANEKLWDAIYGAVRVYEDSDPVELWEQHLDELGKRRKVLNGYNFRYLRYKNSIGTDLTVELPENHKWEGGGERAAAGFGFVANMPTEETFTVPKRDGVNGRVVASMPLVLNGNIIDGFEFTLKDGRVIDFDAKKGRDFLASTLDTDEGSRFFGECALVQYDSPISNSKILFYNTLFDENASCHFALGKGYPCIKGAGEMSQDELRAAGVNDSIIHVDFMVGTPDLSIVGETRDGKRVPVFVDGNFAF